MTTQEQHTPGPLTADATVPRGGQKPRRYLFSKTNVVVAEVGGPCRCYSKRTQKANAERLALAWNCHDGLVAALKEMVEQYGGMVDGGVEEPAALAVDHAKAALAKAEPEAPQPENRSRAFGNHERGPDE